MSRQATRPPGEAGALESADAFVGTPSANPIGSARQPTQLEAEKHELFDEMDDEGDEALDADEAHAADWPFE